MKVSKHIDIFLTKKRNVNEINVSQLDTGIQLVFNVKDFNIPSGSSATLYAEKPSGKFVYQTKGITIVKNTITVDLENQAIAEHGKTPYQVSIENGSDVVTSFIGVMNVQRSLKDSGATESKTVMRAFDELTDEKLAEFQERAEIAARGVIATIPEDYTEMTAKVNELANAIKGSLSGAVIRADDVSPVEHYPVVKVHGKNLLNNTELVYHPEYTELYSSALAVYDYYVEQGKTYTISFDTENTGKLMYLNPNSGFNYVQFTMDGKRHSFTKKITKTINNSVAQLALVSLAETTAVECGSISNVQLEESEAATEYTPYVDPSTVTVTAGGVTYTPNADGTINGISSTVLADGISTEAEGMTIECEYNKDTNKVISKLVNAISAMGGEVTI